MGQVIRSVMAFAPYAIAAASPAMLPLLLTAAFADCCFRLRRNRGASVLACCMRRAEHEAVGEDQADALSP